MLCIWNPSRILPVFLVSILLFLGGTAIASGSDKAARPRIIGIDHVIVYVTDVKKSRQFYSEVLGFRAKCPQFRGPETCLLVRPSNQRLLLKAAPALPGDLNNWIAEIAFATDNLAQMRSYLSAHGFAADPTTNAS